MPLPITPVPIKPIFIIKTSVSEFLLNYSDIGVRYAIYLCKKGLLDVKLIVRKQKNEGQNESISK
ncbi:hypothetical protein PPE04_11390 [Pediococcus pentosaceus]|nr:hypothetical protein PPE04_11390 [Pediococcus pentosaceus]